MSPKPTTATRRSGTRSAGPRRPTPAPTARAARERERIFFRVAAGAAGVAARILVTDDLQALAAEWLYVLRNRSRWAGSEELRAGIGLRAAATLKTLGIGTRALENLTRRASSGLRLLEIEIPAGGRDGRAALDAACAFPWEFVVSQATRHAGRLTPLLITRCLRMPRRRRGVTSGAKLFVESGPGRLADCYDFSSELERLDAVSGEARRNPRDLGGPWVLSQSPEIGTLARTVRDRVPGAIHVSGVDNHQVARLLEGFYAEAVVRKALRQPDADVAIPEDGVILSGTRPAEMPVPYDQVAAALIPSGLTAPPRLITFNTYYSGARLARACVERGAAAALGILDEVNDELAEYFFQTFYDEWLGAARLDAAVALGSTWSILKENDRDLFGTVFALWTAESSFGSVTQERLVHLHGSDASRRRQPSLPTPEQRQRARQLPMKQVLQVGIDIPDTINYSLLHNGRRMLPVLTLNKLVDFPLDEVGVVVRLDLGEGSPEFRHTELMITERQIALADMVRIPLTAALLRSVHEELRATLYVRITWDQRIVHEETRPVTIVPVDQWLDDTASNPWLPSFVLPRDPAVARIVAAARPHLVAVRDDPTASFDGYQAVDGDDRGGVDRQVQAMWTSLVHEFKLQYINPPPAYAEREQRLRTPSEVLASGTGTCIDLALLLASCLEYIDIYPVVVLLSGHAFVGYWRDEVYHDEFNALAHIPSKLGVGIGPIAAPSRVALVDPDGWRLARQHYREILEYARRDKIRFLEATGLCFNYSFAEALEEGRANLKVPGDFDSLLDIRLARTASPPVTPLPVLFGRPA